MTTSLTDRLVGIDAEGLRAVPEVIGLVYGRSKGQAVRAAVHGGLVNGLVTHPALALELLDRV